MSLVQCFGQHVLLEPCRATWVRNIWSFFSPLVLSKREKNIQVFIFFEHRAIYDYSRVPNKRTGRLLENEKKSHLYALIRNYTIIDFQQKVSPIRLFTPIFSKLFAR